MITGKIIFTLTAKEIELISKSNRVHTFYTQVINSPAMFSFDFKPNIEQKTVDVLFNQATVIADLPLEKLTEENSFEFAGEWVHAPTLINYIQRK